MVYGFEYNYGQLGDGTTDNKILCSSIIAANVGNHKLPQVETIVFY